MVIEKTKKEIIILLSSSIDMEDLQDFLNYARYKELTKNIKVDQSVIDKLASDINSSWW